MPVCIQKFPEISGQCQEFLCCIVQLTVSYVVFFRVQSGRLLGMLPN
jgi:hypothetical protein